MVLARSKASVLLPDAVTPNIIIMLFIISYNLC